jgi:hypothetical protein
MRGSLINRLMGRSPLRERYRRRALPIGECPHCGRVLESSSASWLDAERVMTEHESTCEMGTVAEASPSVPRPNRSLLRPA